MFKKLKVDNFKSLVDFAIDFEPMSVIIGNNATGKSTILQVIDFLCSTVREDFEIILERRGLQVDNIKSKITGSNKIHFTSTIVLTEGQKEVEYVWDMVLNAVASKNTVQLQSETVKIGKDTLLEYGVGKEDYVKIDNTQGEFLVQNGLILHSSVMKLFKENYIIDSRLKALINFLDNSASFEMLSPSEMRLSSRGGAKTIGMSGKNLPSFIRQMSQEQKKHFMEKVEKILSGRISDVETKTQGRPGWTQIQIKENYKNKTIAVNSKEMSDGMLRLLAFIAICEIQKGDATMLLDEIENGINANYAESLLDTLKSTYQEKEHQLIVTTHSTVFLDYVEPLSIVFLYRDDNGVTKAVKLFENAEMKKKLEYMWPGEIILNLSQSELIDKLLLQ